MFHIPGESLFLSLSSGHRILIDGGMDDTAAEKLSTLTPFWNRSLDAVIISHSDLDHISGLFLVLSSFPVKSILLSGAFGEDSDQKKALLHFIQEKKIPVFFLHEQRDFSMGNIWFDVLFPSSTLLGVSTGNQNQNSLVFRGVFPKESVLFMGDTEKTGEKNLLMSSHKLSSSILKVGHHGSQTSSIPKFLDAVSPSTALISASKDNPFGHPHTSVVQSFFERNIMVHITKDEGDIAFSL